MGGVCTNTTTVLPDPKEVIEGTQIPEWVSAAGQQLYEQSAELASSEFPQFTGPRVATYGTDEFGNPSKLTPEEREAAKLLAGSSDVAQPFIDDAKAMADQLGQGFDPLTAEELLGPEYSGATRQELIGDPFTVETAQPFLDVYQRAVDPAVEEIRRQTQANLITDAAEASRVGAFGGSRLGLREAFTTAEGARLAGDVRAEAGAAGLDFAAGRTDADRVARFRAEEAMRGQFESDRDARFLAEDTRRAAFETDEASKLRATETLQGFAPLVQGLQEQTAAGMLTAGEARRALDQAALDLAYADYVEQREFPFQMINFALGALQGVPFETRTIGLEQGQQFVQNPSIYGQTLGALGSLASAYYLARG